MRMHAVPASDAPAGREVAGASRRPLSESPLSESPLPESPAAREPTVSSPPRTPPAVRDAQGRRPEPRGRTRQVPARRGRYRAQEPFPGVRVGRPGRLRRPARPDAPGPACRRDGRDRRDRSHASGGCGRDAGRRTAHELAVHRVHRDRLGRGTGGPAARHRGRGPERRHRRGAGQPAAAVPAGRAVRPDQRPHRAGRLRAGPLAQARCRVVPPRGGRPARPAGAGGPGRHLLVDAGVVARPAGERTGPPGWTWGGARHRRGHPVPGPGSTASAWPGRSSARCSRERSAGCWPTWSTRHPGPTVPYFVAEGAPAGTGLLRRALR